MVHEGESLRERLVLLAKQREDAEAHETQRRINELPQETENARAEYDQLLATFHEQSATLAATVVNLVDTYKKMEELHDEQNFYCARFAPYTLERQELTDAGVMPAPSEESRTIFAPITHLRLSWEHARTATTQWGRKLEEWEARQQQPEPRAA